MSAITGGGRNSRSVVTGGLLRRIVPLALLAAVPGMARAQAAEPLTVCLAEANAPLSWRAGGAAHGLDASLAGAIAAAAGRPLRVVFFESAYERDKNSAFEMNALVAAGVCRLVTGFALFASDLAPPAGAVARTADYEGAPPRRQRAFLPLAALAPSRAYLGSTLGVVVRAEGPSVASLADLQGLRVAVTAGTVAGSALARYRGGLLIPGMRTISQREDPFALLESGAVEAAFAPLGRKAVRARSRMSSGPRSPAAGVAFPAAALSRTTSVPSPNPSLAAARIRAASA